MILVTVGTHNVGFERLVRPADMLAAEIAEQVIIQYGSSTYIPHYATAFTWATSQEMQILTARARVVIAHAAAGTILVTLLAGKPLVVVPRLKTLDKMMDDHQTQLSKALNQAGRAVEVRQPTPETLQDAITKALTQVHGSPSQACLVHELRVQLYAWMPNHLIPPKENQPCTLQ